MQILMNPHTGIGYVQNMSFGISSLLSGYPLSKEPHCIPAPSASLKSLVSYLSSIGVTEYFKVL